MEDYSLQVALRNEAGVKPRKLRAEGLTPGVVYGGKKDSQNVQVDSRELDRLLSRGGASHLINLEGAKFPATRVLIREVQRHPVRREILHIDFVRVSKGQKIRMAVPIHLVGESEAVHEGAILLQNVDALEVECLPDSLPSKIEIDISSLVHIHDRIYAADLTLPEGVSLYGDYGDEALISLSVPRSAAAEEEAEEETTGEPEIISERQEEEDEE